MNSLHYLSPRFLLIIAGILLFSFTLVPVGIYQFYIAEPDLMFGNITLYGFMSISLMFIWLGTLVGRRIRIIRPARLPSILALRPLTFFFVPVIVSIALLALTISVILHNDPVILFLALSGNAQAVKQALKTAGVGAFTGSVPLAMGISWWGEYQYLRFSTTLPRVERRLIAIFLMILIFSLFLAETVLASRNVIMPSTFGLFLIFLRHKIIVDRVRIGGIVLRASIILILILCVFGVFASLRTSGGSDVIIRSYIGYGPASVNHLAALLDGRFNFFALKPYFVSENFGFFYQFPFVERFVGNTQQAENVLHSSFAQTYAAGLNGSYIWMTSFGEIFGQLGIFWFFYLILYGIVVARTWKSFVAGNLFGVVVYPFAAFNILFSFGSNYFASGFSSVLLVLTLLLWGYTEFFGGSLATVPTSWTNFSREKTETNP